LKLKENEEKEKELLRKRDSLISSMPNLQMDDSPVGDETKNKVIHTKGTLPKIKNPKSHVELGEALDILDIKRATKLSGEGFSVLKGTGARMQRALAAYMLDFHNTNGFVEVNPPQLVNQATMFGTGQLPKFADDLYRTQEGLYLIPTSEVPVTNLFSQETLVEKDLPKKFCAYTQCYRTEKGRRAGEEGLFRMHQFDKVEMVYLCREEDSEAFLEEMVSYAERILENLGLPYRRVLLSTQDAGFASAKTYDLEVWSPSMKRWLEVSSCSNCMDFQARRMNTRYQAKDGSLKFIHTLNGSGLALSRIPITILENFQQDDGSVIIPKVLHKYTGFKVIKPVSKK